MERSTKEQPKKRLGTFSGGGWLRTQAERGSWQWGRAQPYRPKPSASVPLLSTRTPFLFLLSTRTPFLFLGYQRWAV